MHTFQMMYDTTTIFIKKVFDSSHIKLDNSSFSKIVNFIFYARKIFNFLYIIYETPSK